VLGEEGADRAARLEARPLRPPSVPGSADQETSTAEPMITLALHPCHSQGLHHIRGRRVEGAPACRRPGADATGEPGRTSEGTLGVDPARDAPRLASMPVAPGLAP
jgi:hypothetical protein